MSEILEQPPAQDNASNANGSDVPEQPTPAAQPAAQPPVLLGTPTQRNDLMIKQVRLEIESSLTLLGWIQQEGQQISEVLEHMKSKGATRAEIKQFITCSHSKLDYNLRYVEKSNDQFKPFVPPADSFKLDAFSQIIKGNMIGMTKSISSMEKRIRENICIIRGSANMIGGTASQMRKHLQNVLESFDKRTGFVLESGDDPDDDDDDEDGFGGFGGSRKRKTNDRSGEPPSKKKNTGGPPGMSQRPFDQESNENDSEEVQAANEQMTMNLNNGASGSGIIPFVNENGDGQNMQDDTPNLSSDPTNPPSGTPPATTETEGNVPPTAVCPEAKVPEDAEQEHNEKQLEQPGTSSELVSNVPVNPPLAPVLPESDIPEEVQQEQTEEKTDTPMPSDDVQPPVTVSSELETPKEEDDHLEEPVLDTLSAPVHTEHIIPPAAPFLLEQEASEEKNDNFEEQPGNFQDSPALLFPDLDAEMPVDDMEEQSTSNSPTTESSTEHFAESPVTVNTEFNVQEDPSALVDVPSTPSQPAMPVILNTVITESAIHDNRDDSKEEQSSSNAPLAPSSSEIATESSKSAPSTNVAEDVSYAENLDYDDPQPYNSLSPSSTRSGSPRDAPTTSSNSRHQSEPALEEPQVPAPTIAQDVPAHDAIASTSTAPQNRGSSEEIENASRDAESPAANNPVSKKGKKRGKGKGKQSGQKRAVPESNSSRRQPMSIPVPSTSTDYVFYSESDDELTDKFAIEACPADIAALKEVIVARIERSNKKFAILGLLSGRDTDPKMKRLLYNVADLKIQAEISAIAHLDRTVVYDRPDYRGLGRYFKAVITPDITAPLKKDKDDQVVKAKLTGPIHIDPLNTTGDRIQKLMEGHKKNGKNPVFATKTKVHLPHEDMTECNKDQEFYKEHGYTGEHKSDFSGTLLATPCFDFEGTTPEERTELAKLMSKFPISVASNVGKACDIKYDMFSIEKLVATADKKKTIDSYRQLAQDEDTNWTFTKGASPWKSYGNVTPVAFKKFGEKYIELKKIFEEAAKKVDENWTKKELDELVEDVLKNQLESSAKAGSEERFLWDKYKPILVPFGTNFDLPEEKFPEEYSVLRDKLPFGFQPNAEKDLLKIIGLIYPGINEVQLYFKAPGSRTSAHIETAALYSVNLNIGPGICRWYAVPPEYAGAVEELIREKLGTVKDGELVKRNSYGMKVWPSLKDLAEKKIPVYIFDQKPDQLVYVGPLTYHWVETTGFATNISYNVGLPTKTQLDAMIVMYDHATTRRVETKIPVPSILWELAERNEPDVDIGFFKSVKYTLARLMAVDRYEYLICEGEGIFRQSNRKAPYEDKCSKCEQSILNIWAYQSGLHESQIKRYCVHCGFDRIKENRRFAFKRAPLTSRKIFNAYQHPELQPAAPEGTDPPMNQVPASIESPEC